MAHCQTAGQHPGPQGISCSCQLVSWSKPQTPLGDADLDGHGAGGSTRSEGTPARLLPITGDRHKGEAIDIKKGYYGPRRLRDDDDDDDSGKYIKQYQTETSCEHSTATHLS